MNKHGSLCETFTVGPFHHPMSTNPDCDIIINDTVRLPAHFEILCQKSQYFNAHANSNMKGVADCIFYINIPDPIRLHLFISLMKSIYTETVVDPKNGIEFMLLCHEYQFPTIFNSVAPIFSAQINDLESALHMFGILSSIYESQYDLEIIYTRIGSVVAENKSILASCDALKEFDMDTFKDFIKRYIVLFLTDWVDLYTAWSESDFQHAGTMMTHYHDLTSKKHAYLEIPVDNMKRMLSPLSFSECAELQKRYDHDAMTEEEQEERNCYCCGLGHGSYESRRQAEYVIELWGLKWRVIVYYYSDTDMEKVDQIRIALLLSNDSELILIHDKNHGAEYQKQNIQFVFSRAPSITLIHPTEKEKNVSERRYEDDCIHAFVIHSLSDAIKKDIHEDQFRYVHKKEMSEYYLLRIDMPHLSIVGTTSIDPSTDVFL
jgi:hypothetical protein